MVHTNGNVMDTLRRHLPIAVPEGKNELKKIAVRFEEKIYTAALNQSDYLRKISLKMLSMETKTQLSASMNPQPSVDQNSTDAASMDSTAQTGHNGSDWQEEIYQKLRMIYQLIFLLLIDTSHERGTFCRATRIPSEDLSEISAASMDSTAQTGHNGSDWQEEIYQKIQAMKEAHFAELQEFHLKISQRFQQNDMMPHKQSENFEKLKTFVVLLERMISFLQMSKSNITIVLKEKLPIYEKQIVSMLSSSRRQKTMPSQQHFHLPGGHAQSTPQHQPSQVLQVQQHENHGNKVQQMNMPGSITTMQAAVASSMQHGSMTLPSLAAPATQQNVTSSVQSASDLDPVQVNSFVSLQQGSMGSVQQSGMGSLQNSVSAAQQTNHNNLSQSSMSGLQPRGRLDL